MIILIKSAPETPEAKRAVALAGGLGADILLIQNAVCLAGSLRTGSVPAAVYALDEDLRLRGLGPEADVGPARRIDYDTLVDLITKADQVHGAF